DLAAKMGIPAAQRDSIIEQVAAAVARWPALAGETGVDATLAAEIQARLGQVAKETLAARG
ncbi:MAG TPA: hypothetical protein VFJ82_08405, partial [Longimicrobium sp.]|nr:hypothetical protein [Longimicrobium sp.]